MKINDQPRSLLCVRKLTDNDRERIDREVFASMEQGDEL